ncbi:MAG: ATP-binding protein, partial [Promethearchaeota archaeon]
FINNGERITQSFELFILPILIYNFSTFLFVFSIILFLLPHLEEDFNRINLDIPSYHEANKGSIKIGKIMKGNRKKYDFHLSIKDLEKHMFICGATGTGKSNFLQNFLIHFTQVNKIPFFLVEFKGEYHFLQKKINDLLILWPGENFSINIFNPENSNPHIHAERIFDILKSGQFLDDNSEFSPQMQKVLVEILSKVCKDKNLQNWKGFEYCCKRYVEKNLNNIPMLKQTLISIKNRIRRFSEGPLKALFDLNNEYGVKTLFKKNVVLDLSSIIRLGGEKEDALFFLNMIFKYLWDKNLTKGAFKYKGIKHITIVEDAQYFAPQDLVKKNKLTTYLEDIALLQRGTGECLIALATRPDISRDILANAGVLLTLKNHIEKDVMCELLNLDLDKRGYLSILEEGQGIIRVNSIKEPFLLWVPYIERESLSFSEIKNKNELILGYKEHIKSFIDKDEKGKFYVRIIAFVNIFLNFCKKIGNELKVKTKNALGQKITGSLKKKKNFKQ